MVLDFSSLLSYTLQQDLPGFWPRQIFLFYFGVNMDLFQDPSVWRQPCSSSRGLERPGALQPGMLDFSPKTVQTSMIAKSCVVLGRSQRLRILEWALVNPEKITSFLKRMKTDGYFRNYYIVIYDALSLPHQRIFDHHSLVVVEAVLAAAQGTVGAAQGRMS